MAEHRFGIESIEDILWDVDQALEKSRG